MDKIVTLTMNPALDKSVSIGHVMADRKLRCGPPRYAPGGGGVNVSRAIRRLGGESLAFYTRGGPIGEMLQDLLAEEGVSHWPLEIEGITRVSFTVFEQASKQQYRFVMPGPELHAVEWRRCLEVVFERESQPDYLVASGSLPPGVPTDFYGRLARSACQAGCRFIVDTSGDELRAAAEAGVYLLKPNMRELRHLAGKEIESEEQQQQVARQLVEQGRAEVVVVSLGAAGALLVSAEGSERVRAPTVRIQSKIGAGDSMVAGLVLALARGQSLSESVHFGVAAGAAAVATPGTELCRREETESLYQR
jgi:6-phosphofructokinase 2